MELSSRVDYILIEDVVEILITPIAEQDIYAFISDKVQNVFSEAFIEGELGFVINVANTSFSLNNLGELIVTAPNANNFFIDNSGNLRLQ